MGMDMGSTADLIRMAMLIYSSMSVDPSVNLGMSCGVDRGIGSRGLLTVQWTANMVHCSMQMQNLSWNRSYPRTPFPYFFPANRALLGGVVKAKKGARRMVIEREMWVKYV
jgi:hypothetical protein